MRIYDEICKALTEQKRITLATIIATAGSTPAPSESKMLLFPDEKARAIGTIGGGCLDANIIVTVRDDPSAKFLKKMDFQLDDDLGDSGLNCGGTVTVALEPLSANLLPLYQKIVALYDDGVDCCLVTQITGNGLSRKSLFSQEGKFLYGSELPPDADGDIRQRIIQARFPHEPVYMQAGPENFILEFIQSQPHLIIFGGGHVGRAVSQCASIAGFRVTVVDDRHPFANKQRFPEAFSVLCENFVESFKRLTITPSTFVVIVTR